MSLTTLFRAEPCRRLATICFFSVVAAGCSSAEYDARMEVAKKRHVSAKKFVVLDASPLPIANVKTAGGATLAVAFRKPSIFNRVPIRRGDKDSSNGHAEYNPTRLTPPFLAEFPGLQSTYEVLNVGGGKNILYLYLGVQPAEGGVAEKIAESLKPAVPEGTDAKWTKVAVENEDGSRTEWNRIGFESEQDYTTFNNNDVNKFPSTFALYMREHLGCQVFIGLRGAMISDPRVDLEGQVAAAVGTVTIAPEAKQ